MSNRTPNRVRSRTFDVPQSQGANALSYAPEPIPASPPAAPGTKRRTTLSVVPSLATKRRIPMLVMFLGMIMASAVAVLLLNVFIANGQYSMVELKGQERALSQENEALRQETQYLAAPQVIAQKATKLGMVKPGTPAAIDLNTGKVTGKATPAVKPEKDEKNSGFLDTPIKPATDVPAPTKLKAEPKNPAPVVEKAPDTTPSVPDAVSPVKEASGSSGTVRPDFTQKQLNGGTIPAPEMKTPGS
jgi:hypothetical protein